MNLKKCERCHKLMPLRKWKRGEMESAGQYARRRFCSLHCANSRGRWGTSSSAYHRDSQKHCGPQCEECGKRTQLHVHHINEDWTDNRKENLRTLCIGCHLGGHNRKEKRPCSVQSCTGHARLNGMCGKHSQRFRKWGDPHLIKAGGRKMVRVND